jgi:hypothetical protein
MKMNEIQNVDDASAALSGVRNEATIENSDNSKVEQENEQEIEAVDDWSAATNDVNINADSDDNEVSQSSDQCIDDVNDKSETSN